jgi:hypothetical protein
VNVRPVTAKTERLCDWLKRRRRRHQVRCLPKSRTRKRRIKRARNGGGGHPRPHRVRIRSRRRTFEAKQDDLTTSEMAFPYAPATMAPTQRRSPDAAEHELERWKNLSVCYRTHATHVGTRQVAATKKLASGQKAAHTRKRRAAGRNAGETRNRPATAAEPAGTGRKRKNLKAATTTQADLSRHALELKLSHPAAPHPGSGPASKGKQSKERQKPLRVGTSKGEVRRVSQEGNVAQARKDSGDR